MDYRVFVLKCKPEVREIFVAELAELGFDMMQETDEGIEAFSEAETFDESSTDELIKRYQHLGVSGEWKDVENTNWNEEWEKNYDPVEVSDKCIIRADFHKISKKYPVEIIINPKMSFGTGHHATTFLMANAMFQLDLKGKKVLDAGCGTGVLAILAEKLGSEYTLAYDVSQLCVENTLENIEVNDCHRIAVETGVVSEIKHQGKYDVILANINKNALLAEMKSFSDLLDHQGFILLSGFFASDLPDLEKEAGENNLRKVDFYLKEDWACLKLASNL